MSTSNGAPPAKWRIAIIGSGNWGSAIARIAGINTSKHSDLFDKDIKMWMFEEQFNGRPLSVQFNEQRENVKYLPGVKIPSNVTATPDLLDAVKGANALVFVIPHQFIRSTCEQLKGKISNDARAISLVKGVEVSKDKIDIFAHWIQGELGIPCAALSGANIADEVARDKFSETTIGCKERDDGVKWVKLFSTDHFRCQLSLDVTGVSLAGALKNVVAVAAGLCDGLGWGNNAKAAIMRIGILEMKRFSQEFFQGVESETFVEQSAGIADLITSCLGGRNRKVAEAFVKSPKKSFEDLEKELLNGQKLQGVMTAKEVHEFLEARGRIDAYPLFNVVYKVAYEGLKPEQMTAHL